MHIVSNGDNLHELSIQFSGKKEKYFNMLSADRVLSINMTVSLNKSILLPTDVSKMLWRNSKKCRLISPSGAVQSESTLSTEVCQFRYLG